MNRYQHPLDIDYAQVEGDGGDTSYVCIVDRDRNVVSFTPSLHTGYGTCVAMGELGFTLNCRGDYFSLVAGHPNALAPGKRPRSTLQSTLVLKDGKPLLVMGSPGGDDQCLRTMQTLLNMVEFDMNVQQAIEAPRWSTRSFPQSYFPHTMYVGGSQCRESDSGIGARSTAGEGTQTESDGWLDARLERGHRHRSGHGSAERRGRSACRRSRHCVVTQRLHRLPSDCAEIVSQLVATYRPLSQIT